MCGHAPGGRDIRLYIRQVRPGADEFRPGTRQDVGEAPVLREEVAARLDVVLELRYCSVTELVGARTVLRGVFGANSGE